MIFKKNTILKVTSRNLLNCKENIKLRVYQIICLHIKFYHLKIVIITTTNTHF